MKLYVKNWVLINFLLGLAQNQLNKMWKKNICAKCFSLISEKEKTADKECCAFQNLCSKRRCFVAKSCCPIIKWKIGERLVVRGVYCNQLPMEKTNFKNKLLALFFLWFYVRRTHCPKESKRRSRQKDEQLEEEEKNSVFSIFLLTKLHLHRQRIDPSSTITTRQFFETNFTLHFVTHWKLVDLQKISKKNKKKTFFTFCAKNFQNFSN